ncbi:FecR family protein [Mucilaginibacter pineti]|uniref:FecR family protein n=1 Tax=Mucilaginibacter pineti TaxID=1391627 RepID=A0A1G7CQW9_9SPHI|nr:FecR family protein [Mucilaginibacter pineti]SDE41814.1 FecR family protein [Mucilaginibacter pineti]
MQRNQLKALIKKYQNSECTEEEKALLERWYLNWNEEDRTALSEEQLVKAQQRLWAGVAPKPKASIVKIWARYVAAAVIVIAVGIGMYNYVTKPSGKTHPSTTAQNIIVPGRNKAYLVLADGKRISLTDQKNGAIATQAGVQVLKTADGQLSYVIADQGHSASLVYNTIETPKGGQYEVVLPDGSKVWLNAVSSLRFPSSFAGLAARKVELKGEAYFEVAKSTHSNLPVPFQVSTNKQEIQVLGTHFNVNSYADEEQTKTTLLEGSVRVQSADKQFAEVLKPGEQSLLSNNRLMVQRANIEEAVAWQNGNFSFYAEDISSIMRKLERWYNIEVDYKGQVTDERYYGSIARSKNITEVLKMLEKAQGVHFKIEGRRVTVMQ